MDPTFGNSNRLSPDACHIAIRWLVPQQVSIDCCGNARKVTEQAKRQRAYQAASLTVFSGVRLIDGTGGSPIEDATIVVRDGRIESIGRAESVAVPRGGNHLNLIGRTVLPGFINAHGHVGATSQVDGAALGRALVNELRLYARYGITTVNSLGGEGAEAVALREAQNSSALNRARIYVAGTVVTGDTPEEALRVVDQNARLEVDFIKIRVDDNLGSTNKMAPRVYRAVIEGAHERHLRVASHLFYLEDAKGLLRAGADLVAPPVNEEFARVRVRNATRKRCEWHYGT